MTTVLTLTNICLRKINSPRGSDVKAGLWSRKSRHPTPTPGNCDYPSPTPDRLRPSAVLVT